MSTSLTVNAFLGVVLMRWSEVRISHSLGSLDVVEEKSLPESELCLSFSWLSTVDDPVLNEISRSFLRKCRILLILEAKWTVLGKPLDAL